MQAVIITVGSELMDGRVTDTNSSWLAHQLEGLGLRVALMLTAPDEEQAIAAALDCALAREPGLVVVAGGLGPTDDDLTAPALAAALEMAVEQNQRAELLISEAVDRRELKPHELKQARLPAGVTVLKPAGTAPGFILEAGAALVAALPGVPAEMKAMWPQLVADPALAGRLEGSRPRRRRTLCFYGIGEPEVAAAVSRRLEPEGLPIEAGICSRLGEVALDIIYDYSPEAQIKVESLTAGLKTGLADFIYSEGEAIEDVVVEELVSRRLTLAVAESCTGGLLGAALTSVAGASACFRGGVVAYHNEVKRSQLKVQQAALDNVGAVSEPVAQQMAIGARTRLGADYGIGVTGVAGPGGGTPDKPVGLVWIAVSAESGDTIRGFSFSGGREQIRRAAVTAALHMLHDRLLAG